ncbi:hypothetical protein ESP02_03370 [Enterococcus sp. NBRC 3427]|nr:hypothetical protein ESP02_03370 [Enterococcus sp. NBRC 3427]
MLFLFLRKGYVRKNNDKDSIVFKHKALASFLVGFGHRDECFLCTLKSKKGAFALYAGINH